MKRLFLLLVVNSMVRTFAFGQQPVNLEEIEIEGHKEQLSKAASKTVKVDTVLLKELRAFSLGDVLTADGSAFIKDNGSGRLSTLSIRGTAASQSAVAWNGLLLNTPTLALFDLSLVPAFLIDDASLQFGGNGPLNGSQAMGGVLHLGSRPYFNSGTHASAMMSAGSFSDYSGGVKVRYGNSRYYTNTAFYSRTSRNNYSFNDIYIAGKPEISFSHAAFFNNALLNEHIYITGKHLFSAHVMKINARREIPALMGSHNRASGQIQWDDQLRTVARWKYGAGKIRTDVMAGYLNDRIRYADTLSGLYNHSDARSIQFSGDVVYTHKNHSLLAGYFQTLLSGEVKSHLQGFMQGYTSEKSDDRNALYINYSAEYFSRLTFHAAVRNEWLKNRTELIPSASIAFRTTGSLYIYGAAGKVYRSPSFNDLYWKPGGNELLLPEHGFQYEGGLRGSVINSKSRFDFSAGAYLISLEDYIQWLPDISNTYAAMNFSEMVSKGLEGDASFTTSGNAISLYIKASVRCALVNTIEEETNVESGQLPYIPDLTASALASVSCKKSMLSFWCNYTGDRFITSDNSSWLDPYLVSGASFSQTLNTGRYPLTFRFLCNNLFDQQYEVVALHPVQGRNFHVSASIEIGQR